METRQILSNFITKFDALSEDDAKTLINSILVKDFKKGETIVEAGETCSQCFFVLKGCLRQYVVVEGIEKTTEFYTEEQAVATFLNTETLVAEQNVVCTEDSLLIVGDVDSESAMYQQVPMLEKIIREMIENDLHKSQAKFSQFIVSSPEQRYQFLLNYRPDLFQRVPQHQLASYIGVTAESLSRIRKRLVAKEKGPKS